MESIDHMDKIQQLECQIADLETQLKQTQQQLDDCLGKSPDIEAQEEPDQALVQYKAMQNELYGHCKLCEANWSDIPAGIFTAHGSEQLEQIAAFKMLATPVTFEMFDMYCSATGQQPPGDNGWGRENRPVINVNYQDALTYARWLSEQTGWQCRLPTEQQWEYACRAGTVTNYWYGDMPDPRMMVMGTGKTMPTPGTRLANPWDLYDMHGNVWEWTASQKGDEFILCGGSWYNKANWLTSSARNISYPNFSNNNWGFRLIRAAEKA